MYTIASLPLLLATFSSLVAADPVVQCVGPATGTNPVTPAEASSAIDSFCGQRDFWDTTIVSPISMGQNHPNRSTALVSSSLVHNGVDNIWLRVSFKEGECMGSFMFTYGADDAAKKQHCIDNFLPIINKVCLPHHFTSLILLTSYPVWLRYPRQAIRRQFHKRLSGLSIRDYRIRSTRSSSSKRIYR